VHRVVPLMARVLEILVAGFLSDRVANRKGLREGLWIINDRCVVHRVGTRTRKAFRNLQVLAGRRASTIVGQEVRRFDDERVPSQ
jgi:hypothetical protein